MKEGDLSSFKEASKQAEKEIPVRWYENRNVANGVALGVTLLALWHRISTSGAPSAPSLVAGAMYGIGAAADSATTIEALSAHDKLVQKGAPTSISETEPSLSHVKTTDDYRKAWKTALALEVKGFILSTLLPELGIGYTAGKLTAAMNNHRIARRLERTAELVAKNR